MANLAIDGGAKVRITPWPRRGEHRKAVVDAVNFTMGRFACGEDSDWCFQGEMEDKYTDAYCEYHGGGFADAVNSGTTALYIALRALVPEGGGDMIISPITNPGDAMAGVLAGFKGVVADSAPGSMNVDGESISKVATPDTRIALITHSGGFPVDMPSVMEVARELGFFVIEDCSQAHGARIDGKMVGTFGDMSAASTMYSKSLVTGSCGGIVYSKDWDLYQIARSYADRGKPFFRPDFDSKDAKSLLLPSLNFNLDEISCAIGLASLGKLEDTVIKRAEIFGWLYDFIYPNSSTLSLYEYEEYGDPSIFFYPIVVDVDTINVSKIEFAQAVAAEGVMVNPHYSEVVVEWPWYEPYRYEWWGNKTPNAIAFRDSSFNLLIHEGFKKSDIEDIVEALLKVEKAYRL